MQTMSFPLPSTEPKRLLYSGKIRDGRFGNQTTEKYSVWEYESMRLAFLDPLPIINYSDESYRVSVNDSPAVEEYFRMHDCQQAGYFTLLQGLFERGAVVADCGCGGGALLDVLKTMAARTIAIEPFVGYHSSLQSRGHTVYTTLESAHTKESGTVDLALSIHVIEHTENPVAYLSEIRKLIKPGGQLLVVTPNLDDVLLKIDFARHAPFFFRKVHNFYFSAEALTWAGAAAGFEVVRSLYYHEFGLANTLQWLRDAKPSGHTALTSINPQMDSYWRGYLEQNGQANQVGIVLRNPIK